MQHALIAHEAFGHGLEMDMFVKDRAKSVEYMNKEVAKNMTFSLMRHFYIQNILLIENKRGTINHFLTVQ